MIEGFEREPLRREITFWGLSAIAINGLIGAGIFALPAAAAIKAGAFSPVMFVICGLLITTVVASFGQVASYFNQTGGPIVYASHAFGPLVGFQTGWLLYFGRVTAFAANTNALVGYASTFWSGFGHGGGRFLAIFTACTYLTAVNIIGVRRGVGTINWLTILKLIPLILFIGFGLSYLEPDLFLEAPVPATGSLARTLLLLVYAYVGFEGALIPAGESRNPKRDLPRALLLTVGVTTLIYFLIQSVSLSILPNLAGSNAPLADAAGVMFGASGILIMTVAAFFSIAGNLSSIMLAAPRMTYALARETSLPVWFGNVHSKYRTPANSIMFLGVLAFALAVSGSFIWLAVMSSLSRMLGYGICTATIPILKKKFGNTTEAFRLPGGYLIPALAFLLCLWLTFQADTASWLMTAGFVGVGAVLYFLSRRAAESN